MVLPSSIVPTLLSNETLTVLGKVERRKKRVYLVGGVTLVKGKY